VSGLLLVVYVNCLNLINNSNLPADIDTQVIFVAVQLKLVILLVLIINLSNLITNVALTLIFELRMDCNA